MIIKLLAERVNSIKICAVFTAVCFIVSTLGANLYAIPLAEDTNKKYEDVFNKANGISNEYGKITSSMDAKSDVTVINIQDLHCHPQTQRNISKLIKEISDKYNLKKVYVEGGYGDIDTSWLNQIKDENVRKQAIEKLMEQGILTGSEYYKLTNNNDAVELKGIDEEKIHKDNVKRLSWIMSQQDKYEQVIGKINKEIKILEKEYVNSKNKRFNYIIDEYLSGKTDSKKFYKQLIKYIRDINNNPDKYNNITAIKLEDYPNISSFITLRQISKDINIKEVSQQLQIVVNDIKNRLPYSVYTRLLKETDNLTNGQKVVELVTLLCKKENIDLTKYQALNFFLESNHITKNINPINLIQEERQLITEIRKALSYNNEEYEITFILDFNKYFEDYLKYKLTDADWKYFETEYGTFRQLYEKYAAVDRIKEIEQDFAQINKYYEINDQRNNIFVKKLLQNEKTNLISDKERDCEDILKGSKEVIIAVTGGFHSSELEQLLASNDVNTIVITPKIYEDIKQANDKYIELISIQSRVNSQALSYTISSCATDTDKQKMLLSITKDIAGDNTELLERVLGEKVDLSILQEPAENIKNKNDVRNVIEQTIEQVLKFIPQGGLRSVVMPDIDELMLSLARDLVSFGIFFSDGMIFDIENSNLNGKDLNGIPAEIYSRMLPSLQKALFTVATKETADIDEQDAQINELTQQLKEYRQNPLSVFDPLKRRSAFFFKLAKFPQIWEEIFFRFIPTSFSFMATSYFSLPILTVPLGLILFTIWQNQFVKAHNVSQWIEQNKLSWSTKDILKATILDIFPSKELKNKFKKFTQTRQIRYQTMQRTISTMLLSLTYVSTIIFATNFQFVIFATVAGIVIHKYLNYVLKVKLNIFENSFETNVPTLYQFLSKRSVVDLTDEIEKQLLTTILNKQDLSEVETMALCEKINLKDLQQTEYLSEIFDGQIKITNHNKKILIESLVKTFNVNNDAQLSFIRSLLLNPKFFTVDDTIATVLADRLNFDNIKQLNLLKDFLKSKIYNKKLQTDELELKLLEKTDVNDISQTALLELFNDINDKNLCSLILKLDFADKSTLQIFFNIISKYNLVQKPETFELILNKTDLRNNIDFKLIRDIVLKAGYIGGKLAETLFAKLDFTNNNHMYLIRSIAKKRNIDLSIIENFTKYMDINDSNHIAIINDIVRGFFLNNSKDSRLSFYEQIEKKLKTLNIKRLNDKEIYVLELFMDKLSESIQKDLIKIQNENIRAKYDKITVDMFFSQNLFDELKWLVNILSSQNFHLSQQAQNNLQEAKEQISFIEDLIQEKVTIKEFATKYDFRFSQQSPNTFFDSNRYSFTKLLSLFPEKVLKHKIKQHSPTYFIEKDEINKDSLKVLLDKFDAYMKLLDENVYVINKFNEVTDFDYRFEDVIQHIGVMIDCLSVFNSEDAETYSKALENILGKINNNQTSVEEQKQFSISQDIYGINTINRLINKIHQKANLDFVSNIRKTTSLSLSRIQNVFVSKDDRTIAAYNLSQKQMNHNIKRLLLMLIENPDFSTYDKSQIFIKDNIFLWNGMLGEDHSARVLIDFSKENENIFVDFSEAETSVESRVRISALKKIFADFGFHADFYNNNNSLVATISKDTGLTNDTDICVLAQKAIIALNNSASLYRTDIPKQALDAATLGIMDVYKKGFFISSFERNIINTKVNNIEFFNRILSQLQLPLIPDSEPGMLRGLFSLTRTESLGQNTIDKYVNNPIEQAFADGYLKINETGYLEKNEKYNPISLIAEKLNNFIDKEIGDESEKEMLYNGAILSQVSEQDLNLKTCGQIGEYILKTGYIKLVNGTLDDNVKGEFLSVKVLIDKNGIIRYSESELVGFPENINNKTGRKELNFYQLRQLLLNEGYDITGVDENFTETELLNYRIRLESDIPDFKMPAAYGTAISSSKDKDIFVGEIGANVFADKFATPENVSIATEYPVSLFTCGSYSSHAGIVLREYKKTAMVINDSQFSDNKLKIKFYQPKGNISHSGKIDVQEIEEVEIELQPNDVVLVDTKNNKLLLFENKLFKDSNGENILVELQQYIDNYNIVEIKEFIEKYKNNELLDKIIEYIHYQAGYSPWLKDVLSNYIEKNINEVPAYKAPSRVINQIKLIVNNYLPHVSGSNVYRFGEEESLNKLKIGAKAANQSMLFSNIEQLRINTGVENVAVPNGIAIDYTVLENLLGKEYRNLYKELEEVIQSNKDEVTKFKELQATASKIRQLIDDIGNSRIKKYIGKTNLKDFKNGPVIVRSSGINEDGGHFSAAGIAESFGDINYENIPNSVINVLSSFFSKKAIEYMLETKTLIKPAVLIEDFIQADKAGIMMSEDSNGNRIIQVVNGQGEDIVSGRKIPATFTMDIESGEKIDGDYTNEKTITNETLDQLTKILEYLEQLEGYPVDVEFVIKDNIIYIVQVRPITTLGYDIENRYYAGYNIEDFEYVAESEGDTAKKEQIVEEEFDKYPKAKRAKEKRDKKEAKKKRKDKKKKTKAIRTTDTKNDDDIRQPAGLTLDEVIKSFTKLSQSKKVSDTTLELNTQQIKNVLVNLGLAREQVEKMDLSNGLPDYVVAFLKSRNTQIVDTKIDPNKTLIENLKEHPILFSLAVQTLIRIFDINPKKADSPTMGDLLSFIEQRYWNKLYEATCNNLRGYFGEIYSVNTLIAGIIPDKRAGPIIIRPQLAELNNARGYDIYNPVDATISQIKIGGSGIVHDHFKKYWLQPSNTSEGIIAIPVLTTRNVKKRSFPTEDRVQGLDVSTETITKFAHEFISALHGISYKRNIPEIRDIKLKDLINSFKGIPTENPITVDELMDLLTNKNQVVDGNKVQKRNERQQNIVYNGNEIDFNRSFVDISNIWGQNIVVRANTNETHVIYIDRGNIFVNEENRQLVEEKDYALYGINSVVFNEQDGTIENLLFNEGTQISTIKVDGEPVGSMENNVPFSDDELKSLYSETKTDGYIDVYLDGDIDEVCHLIKKAATEKKLIVFHLFEKGFKTSELTPSQLLDVYKKIASLISNRFKLSDIFPGSLDAVKYTDYGLDFFMDEMLKNSFIHGNAGNIEQPIAMYIKLDKNNEVKDFSIYNKQKQETIEQDKKVLAVSSHLILTGNRKSTDIMKHNPVREYKFDEEYTIGNTIFQKAEVKSRPFVDMDLYRLEQSYKNAQNKNSMYRLLLQTKPTVEKLYEIGLKKYTKQYLKRTEKAEQDLTVDELYEIEEIAENYRYTFGGIVYGVLLETFSLFSKDFISDHGSMTFGMKTVVWVIRSLSIGLGITAGIISFSVLPVSSLLLAIVASSLFGASSTIVSGFASHLLWNIATVLTNNKENLLQRKEAKIVVVKTKKDYSSGKKDKTTVLELPRNITNLPAEIINIIELYQEDDDIERIKQEKRVEEYLKLEYGEKDIVTEEKRKVEMFEKQVKVLKELMILGKKKTKKILEEKTLQELTNAERELFNKICKLEEQLTTKELNDFYFNWLNSFQNSDPNKEINKIKETLVSVPLAEGKGAEFKRIKKEREEEIKLYHTVIKQNIPKEIIRIAERAIKTPEKFNEREHEFIHDYINDPEQDAFEQARRESIIKFLSVFYAKRSWESFKKLYPEKIKEDLQIGEYIELKKGILLTYDRWKHICDGHSILTNGNEIEGKDRYLNADGKYDSYKALKSAMTLEKICNNAEKIIEDKDVIIQTKKKKQKDSFSYIKRIGDEVYVCVENDGYIVTCYVIDGDLYEQKTVQNILETIADSKRDVMEKLMENYENNVKNKYIVRVKVYKSGEISGKSKNQRNVDLSFFREVIGYNSKSNEFIFREKDKHIQEVETMLHSREINLREAQQYLNLLYAVLPENMDFVNESLQKGDNILKIATKIAVAETRDSLLPNFVERHESLPGKVGASQIREFLKKYMPVAEKAGKISARLGRIVEKIIIGASVVKHIAIDYKFIKSSRIQEAIKMFGTKARLSAEGTIEIGIIEDIEQANSVYELENTGIKINGSGIYRIKNSNLLIYGAKGQQAIKVAKTLDGSDVLNKDIIKMLKSNGEEVDKIQTEGILETEGEGIGISDDILEIGELELKGKTQQQINDFISSALEIKRAMGIMYSQKTIIDLKKLTGSELLKAIENGRARKVITAEQYNEMQLSKEKISELKEKGIEIYIADNEIKNDYTETGISGQIIRENGKPYIYDYYSMDKAELDEITDQKELSKLEQKLLNSDNLIMVDIEILKKTFQGRNPIESFSRLGALTGKIKMTMGLGDIKIKDVENIGYNISFDKIPEIGQFDVQKLAEATSKEEIINIIGRDNEFAIILNSLKDENVNRFKNLVIERILMKKILTDTATAIEGVELQDKNLEILLGKLLFRQLNYIDKETVKEEIISERDLMKTLGKLKELDTKQKAEEIKEQQVLVNTLIELILYDGQRVKGKQVKEQTAISNMANYRAMLAAA